MSAINDLFSSISSEERPSFVRYLNTRNRRSDARNIQLFQSMVDGNEDVLKSTMGTNAFNVLRNRLKHRMIDFIGQSTIEQEGSGEDVLAKQFYAAKRLLKNGYTDSAFSLLLKAEREAHKSEHYTLEGEIQQLLISTAYFPGAPKLAELHQRSISNHELQRSRTQLNLAYARIKLAYQAIEFGGERIDLAELLNATFSEFLVSDEIAFSFSSLNQLVQLADIHGAYTKNYHEVNLFFIDKLTALRNSDRDNEQNSHDHIEILYTIANIYFRKKDFKTSSQFLDQMKFQMNRFKSTSSAEHELKWHMLSALNLNHLGKNVEARELIDSALSQSYTSNETTQIRLALAMLQIQQGELRHCQRTLSKFTHSDAWYEKQLGIEWTLHKLTVEILLHIDLENYDFAESRLKSLLRKYKLFLQTEGKDQARPFLLLIQRILRDPPIVSSSSFHSKVETSIAWKKAEEEDVFRINFYAWLKARMMGADVYQTLLELLE